MNPQLQWITHLLEKHDVPYWLDSGTLLGVVRDGDVMDHDKDIDLSVWEEDVDKLRSLGTEFKKAGYRIQEGVFEGKPYNLLLYPKGKGITISVGVNRRRGDMAWRMATFVTDNPHSRWGFRFFLLGAWRFPLRYLTWLLSRKISRARLVNTWPFSQVLQSGVWIFPLEYVERTITHEPTGLPIPVKWEAYLTCRYGDWRKPVKDWAWYRDDGAAHVGNPERLVEQATRKSVETKG